jgi:hypothetical protein
MKTVRIKIRADIFQETEKMLEKVGKPLNDYVAEAVDFYNKKQRRLWLEKQFAHDASLIDESSMEVLREMENLDPHLLDEWNDTTTD